MVSSWLLKVVIAIIVVGFAAFEVGSPLITQTQADGAAHDVADEMAFRFDGLKTEEAFQDACKEEAAKKSVEIVSCTYERAVNQIVVRVRKRAKSVLLKNLSATKSWYVREVTASSTPK